ncbi:MAG: hypothetical protein AAFP69_15845, partial [Planctomycetota bacterium]
WRPMYGGTEGVDIGFGYPSLWRLGEERIAHEEVFTESTAFGYRPEDIGEDGKTFAFPASSVPIGTICEFYRHEGLFRFVVPAFSAVGIVKAENDPPIGYRTFTVDGLVGGDNGVTRLIELLLPAFDFQVPADALLRNGVTVPAGSMQQFPIVDRSIVSVMYQSGRWMITSASAIIATDI